MIHSSLLIIEELEHSKESETYPVAYDVFGITSASFLVIWFLMLMITCLYFHSLMEIVVGSVFGVMFWMAIHVFRIVPQLNHPSDSRKNVSD